MREFGNLIILEGPDGVGKSTLSMLLYDHLRRKNVECSVHSFPGKDEGTLGALVYALHHDLKRFGVKEAAPESLQLMHIAAHVDAIQRILLPALQREETVILDRFWWSIEMTSHRCCACPAISRISTPWPSISSSYKEKVS